MKRKSLVTFIVILMVVISLIACVLLKKNKDDDNGVRTLQLFSDELNQNAKPVFIKFEMEEDVTGEGLEKIVMTYAVNGEKTYTNIDATISVGTIKNEDGFFTLMHNDKKYAKLEEAKYSEDLNIFNIDITKIDQSMITKGKKVINGHEYKYEEIKNGEQVIKYYYDMYIEKFAYVETNNELIRILDYNNNVDDALFEIPEDYTEIIMN